jgi:hypothetical protein
VKMLYRRNSKVCIALAIVVVLAGFVGCVCWSTLSWISADSFRETLQKDGFIIIQASDGSFLWLPPLTSVTCQNQTQFINEARSLNTTGRLLGGNSIYQLDIFRFYAVTQDTTFAYEYTLPHPSFLDPLIDVALSPLGIIAFFVVLIIIGLAAIPLLIAQIIKKWQKLKRKTKKGLH